MEEGARDALEERAQVELAGIQVLQHLRDRPGQGGEGRGGGRVGKLAEVAPCMGPPLLKVAHRWDRYTPPSPSHRAAREWVPP